MTLKNNSIEHPKHYNVGKIEVIDAILDWNLNFCEGNIIKYIVRSDHKGNRIEDLKKAKQYIEFLIEYEENKNNS